MKTYTINKADFSDYQWFVLLTSVYNLPSDEKEYYDANGKVKQQYVNVLNTGTVIIDHSNVYLNDVDSIQNFLETYYDNEILLEAINEYIESYYPFEENEIVMRGTDNEPTILIEIYEGEVCIDSCEFDVTMDSFDSHDAYDDENDEDDI